LRRSWNTRGRHGEVCHVAGGEQQRARPADECREFLFERVVLATVTAHQVRRAAADAPLACGRDECRDDARVIGEPQVVVAAESEQLRAVDAEVSAARRSPSHGTPGAQAPGVGEPGEAGCQ
jgi:hypothetical protein